LYYAGASTIIYADTSIRGLEKKVRSLDRQMRTQVIEMAVWSMYVNFHSLDVRLSTVKKS
jgi:hypothetical protein